MHQDQNQFLDHLETELFKSTQSDLGASQEKSLGVIHLRVRMLWEKTETGLMVKQREILWGPSSHREGNEDYSQIRGNSPTLTGGQSLWIGSSGAQEKFYPVRTTLGELTSYLVQQKGRGLPWVPSWALLLFPAKNPGGRWVLWQASEAISAPISPPGLKEMWFLVFIILSYPFLC